MANEFLQQMNTSTSFYTDKINYIAALEKDIRKYMLYEILFEKFNKKIPNITYKRKSKLTFKELFRKPNECDNIINLLIEKDVIHKSLSEEKYYFKNEMTIDSKHTTTSILSINKTFIMVLARTLMEKGYYKKDITARQVLDAFQLFFNLVDLLYEQKYSDIKNNPHLYKTYFDCLKFIPRL